MAYQLKTIQYLGTSRKILLQNINGPCPLLAAANALLLRGVISLSGECIRNGVASTEDVVNVLAGWAVERSSSNATIDDEYHLNEVLSLLPSLQHGMDVNPKFNSVTGVEYTNNLAVFDSLGVKLVHGWIVDSTASDVVGSKSYNELIEIVIGGNDAMEDIEKLTGLLMELENKINTEETENNNDADNNEIATSKSSQSNAVFENTEEVECSDPRNQINEFCDQNDQTDTDLQKGDTTDLVTLEKRVEFAKIDVANTLMNHEEYGKLQNEIKDIRERIAAQREVVSKSQVINDFLSTSSHQLTYKGLEQMHTHIPNDDLCVFFRNNHFATITKHNNELYLLVTDLGYANTPEIVWEKLDTINGDTEHANDLFCRPERRDDLTPATGPTIDPELLLAQRSQAESDYALAKALSEGRATSELMNADESKLIAAATEASLQSYHGENGTIHLETDSSYNNQVSQVDTDREVAMAFQREQEQIEHESEQLARQLQEMEYIQHQKSSGANRAGRPVHPTSPSRKSGATSDKCVIS